MEKKEWLQKFRKNENEHSNPERKGMVDTVLVTPLDSWLLRAWTSSNLTPKRKNKILFLLQLWSLAQRLLYKNKISPMETNGKMQDSKLPAGFILALDEREIFKNVHMVKVIVG